LRLQHSITFTTDRVKPEKGSRSSSQNDNGVPTQLARSRTTAKAVRMLFNIKAKLSERRFLKALGVSPVREQSGKEPGKTRKSGSALCRKALWQWCFTRLETGRHLRNEVGIQLHSFLTAQKDNGVPTKLARSRTTAKAARMLFKALVKELSPFASE